LASIFSFVFSLMVEVFSLATVNEDAPNGTIVVTLTTTDADEPDHATKMFYISGGNDQGHFR